VALYHRIAWALSAQGELYHRKSGRSIFSTWKNTSLPAAGRWQAEKDNLKVELRTGMAKENPGFLLSQE